jgi:hypothetical protein
MILRFIRATGGARGAVTALAVLAALGLASPPASAQVSLSYTVSGAPGASGSLTSGNSVNGTSNSIAYTLTSTVSDNSGGSNLSTTNIDTNNTSSTSETITIVVTGTNFTFGGTALPYDNIETNMTVTAQGGNPHKTTDSVSLNSSTAGTALGPITGSPPSNGSLTVGYTLSNPSGTTTPITVTLGATPSFAITQTFVITLAGKDTGNFTIQTAAIPEGTQSVPEPSSLAIAGIGALGMIGYGLRRRKALGA